MRKLTIIALSICILSVGCSGASGEENPDGLDEGLGTNVTGTAWTGLASQSESVVSVSNVGGGQIITTTFNDDTPALCFPPCANLIQYPNSTTRRVYPGASLMGWATSQDRGSSWTYRGKVSPPTGWAALWGDPAIARAPNNQSYVFISNLAIQSNKVPPVGYMEGPLDSYLSGACIARSTNGGISFSIAQCFHNNSHFYDGSSLAVTSDGRVFAAFIDITTGKIDVWRSPTLTGTFSKIGDPFPGEVMATHPRLVAWNNNVYILAQVLWDQTRGPLKLNKVTSGGVFSTAVWASEGGARIPITPGAVVMSDRQVRFGPQYDFDVAGASSVLGDDQIRIVFTARDPAQNNKLYIDSTRCNLALGCSSDTGLWNSKYLAGDQFNPTVSAFPGFIGAPLKWMGAYWSRNVAPTGNQVTLQKGQLAAGDLIGRAWFTSQAVGAQVPCSDTRGYWGDYHEIKFLDLPNGVEAAFIIPFSDSSQGCLKRWQYTSQHLHVSSVVVI